MSSSPKPPNSRRPETGPGGGLPALMARLVEPLARDAADPLRRIRLAWGRICGLPLARHIEPLRLENGVLHVGARGPVWRDAVFHQRNALLRHVRRYATDVDRIWLHTLHTSAPVDTPPPLRPTPTPRTAGISHPELRLAVEGLLAARRPDAAPGDSPRRG